MPGWGCYSRASTRTWESWVPRRSGRGSSRADSHWWRAGRSTCKPRSRSCWNSRCTSTWLTCSLPRRAWLCRSPCSWCRSRSALYRTGSSDRTLVSTCTAPSSTSRPSGSRVSTSTLLPPTYLIGMTPHLWSVSQSKENRRAYVLKSGVLFLQLGCCGSKSF